jgi:hypothetical protein
MSFFALALCYLYPRVDLRLKFTPFFKTLRLKWHERDLFSAFIAITISSGMGGGGKICTYNLKIYDFNFFDIYRRHVCLYMPQIDFSLLHSLRE